MHPRTGVLLVTGFASVLLAAIATLLPTPYVELRPGPAINTLGAENNKPLIAINGHATYPTTGALDLTTVSILGGPGARVNLLQLLYGWLDPDVAVVPQEEVFPRGQTQQQSDQQNQQEMTTSQEDATVAALTLLGIPVPTTLTVADLDKASPAAAVLQAKDVITAINGATTTDLSALRRQLQTVKPGQPVQVTVTRAGKSQTVTVRTRAGDGGRTVLGVFLDPTFHFPFEVKIQIQDVGGPSAGTMFALGIIDRLTPGSLTGGQQIAGTGTMDTDGNVGPIGGIQQKMVGARSAGARWFLAPADNCNEVVGHVPDGLHVVRISTLADAKTAVEKIAAGTGTASLPRCS